MARPKGSENKDKPFREALRLQLNAAGANLFALRQIADRLIEMANSGDVQAIKEIADRLDGKPAQAVAMTHDASEAFIRIWSALSEQADRGLAQRVAEKEQTEAVH